MSDKSPVDPQCAICGKKIPICSNPDEGSGPAFCPTIHRAEEIDQMKDLYSDPETAHFAQEASRQEAACYSNRELEPFVMHPTKPRIQEIVEFAHRMGYTKLGIGFCAGLKEEAKVVHEILTVQGFEVVSARCKVGAVNKDFLGLGKEDFVRPGDRESMCNPLVQAELLNRAKTQFNILVGLCVGHDSLFFKGSEAPVTVLVAKDRVTGHNPVAALYTARSYYQRLMRPGIEPAKKDEAGKGLEGEGEFFTM